MSARSTDKPVESRKAAAALRSPAAVAGAAAASADDDERCAAKRRRRAQQAITAALLRSRIATHNSFATKQMGLRGREAMDSGGSVH